MLDAAGLHAALIFGEVQMDRVIEFLNVWLGFLFEGARTTVGATIDVFEWPAGVVGVPPELFAAALLCVILVVLWRALGPMIT
jgi:hypothetical protein